MAAVLVHVDLAGDRPHASSLVALAAGRHVASSWGATLYAAVVVHDPHHPNVTSTHPDVAATTMPTVPGLAEAEAALARAGADKVVIAVSRGPVAPMWSAVGSAWRGVVDHLRPRLVLFGADAPSAAELGPRTAARIGARLLLRARAGGSDEVELRDRDGSYARVGDGGATVAMVGRAPALAAPADPCEVDVVVLALPGSRDYRIELVTSAPAEIAHAAGTVLVLGDDIAHDARVTARAHQLARLLNAHVVGGAAALRAGAVDTGAIVDPATPLAPELVVTIGGARVDVAGATSVIEIGATPATRVPAVDGVIPGVVETGLVELLRKLEAS